MSPEWFSGLGPASAAVPCGSEVHTVRWCNGIFSTPDHADPESERALAALAGEPCRCVELLDAWERHAADPLVLILGPRDREEVQPRDRMIWGRRVTPTGPSRRPASTARLGPAATPPVDPLDRLLCLEGEIPRRYVATVFAALVARGDPALATTLEAAMFGRLLASLRRWSGQIRWVTLELSDGPAALTRDPDHGLLAELRLGWLTGVWGRGLEVVDDELTLSARADPSGTMEIHTVDHAMATHTRTLPAP